MWDNRTKLYTKRCVSFVDQMSFGVQLYWNFPKPLCLSVESTEAAHLIDKRTPWQLHKIRNNEQKNSQTQSQSDQCAQQQQYTWNSHIWQISSRKGQTKRIQRLIYTKIHACVTIIVNANNEHREFLAMWRINEILCKSMWLCVKVWLLLLSPVVGVVASDLRTQTNSNWMINTIRQTKFGWTNRSFGPMLEWIHISVLKR